MVHEDKQNSIIFTDILEERAHTDIIDYENTFGAPKVTFCTYYNGINLIISRVEDVGFARKEIFYAAPWKDPMEVALPYSVDLPVMIDDGSNEFAVFRDWFLERKFELLKQRLLCDVTWRQNPMQEVGDKVLMQVNRQNLRVSMCAVRQMIEFKSGVLKGKTRAIGQE